MPRSSKERTNVRTRWVSSTHDNKASSNAYDESWCHHTLQSARTHTGVSTHQDQSPNSGMQDTGAYHDRVMFRTENHSAVYACLHQNPSIDGFMHSHVPAVSSSLSAAAVTRRAAKENV